VAEDPNNPGDSPGGAPPPATNSGKYVLIPEDLNGDGILNPDQFPPATTDYTQIPGEDTPGGPDDIPVDGPTPMFGQTVPASRKKMRDFLSNLKNKTQTAGSGENTRIGPFVDPTNIRQSSTSTSRNPAGRTLADLGRKYMPGRRQAVSPGQGLTSRDLTLGDLSNRRDYGTALDTTSQAPESPYGGDPGALPQPEQTVVSDVLLNNRFAPVTNKDGVSEEAQAGVYAPGDVSTDRFDASTFFTTLQKKMGAYTPVVDEGTGKNITLDEMQRIALTLVQEAVGGGEPGGMGDVLLRTGAKKIDVTNLRPKNALPDLYQEKVSNDAYLAESDARKSYGVNNTPDQMFDRFFPATMVLIAVATIAATIAAVFVTSFVIQGGAALVGASADQTAPYAPGSSKKSSAFGNALSNFVSLSDFGLISTKNNIGTAAQRGMKVFLGIPAGGDTGDLSFLGALVRTPGFYVNIGRAVLRDAIEIQEKFENAGPGIGGFGAAAASAILEDFKTSKLVAAINMFAAIGDANLEAEKKAFDIDKLNGESVLSHATKSRQDVTATSQPGKLKLAWRNSSVKSTLLNPVIVNSAINASSKSNLLKAPDGIDFKSPANNRMAPEDVEKIEDSLEAEYVPFYFHDLRTNEIAAFHAFLTNLNDNFTVTYDSADFYGRADPVQTYSSTRRNLQFSFYVAATNPEDFDSMWFKINKLITLLYPQYSQGRELVNSNGGKIIVPFSQVYTASPMIRLRIGDVVKSNFSKFNLQRLFGLGTSQFDPKGGEVTDEPLSTPQGAAERTKQIEIIEKAKKKAGPQPGQIWRLSTSAGKVKSVPKGTEHDLNAIKGTTEVFAIIGPTPGITPINTPVVFTLCASLEDAKNSKPIKDFGDGSLYTIGRNALAPILESKDIKAAEAAALASLASVVADGVKKEAYAKTISDFFNEDSNVVVKSFKESSGRGLAGVIKSMNFTWIDNAQITWETDLFKRAPKICQIQISFEPVHDIAPGIDHTGINRAPVYQVGDSVNRMAQKDAENENARANYKKQRDLLGAGSDGAIDAAISSVADALTGGGS
tara:strand:+ start:15357 stop:18530 length:3174 start_codon:yes stop_codon:yes gene_type:complete